MYVPGSVLVTIALTASSTAAAADVVTYRVLDLTGFDDTYDLLPADLDGDGDPDLIALAATGQSVVWRENLGGSLAPEVQLAVTSATRLAIADLDGDGAPDVLTASSHTGEVHWHRNLGGALGAAQLVTGGLPGVDALAAADLDSDGDLDLAFSETQGAGVSWVPNLGGGLFGATVVLDAAIGSTGAVAAGDLDGDGDPELLALALGSSELRVYDNLGGVFAAGATLAILPGFGQVLPLDVDGDGALDLVTSGVRDLSWRQNLGAGAFAAPVLLSDTLSAGRLASFDPDGDGDPDLVALATSGGVVVAFENAGGGFGPLRIIGRGRAPMALAAADLDADGDDDLVVPWLFDAGRAYESVVGARYGSGDYGGADLILADGDQLSGTLTNVGLLHVPAGAIVTVAPTIPVVIEATGVLVVGTLDGTGAGEPGSGGLGGAHADGIGPGGGTERSYAGAGGGAHGGRGGRGAAVDCGELLLGGAGGWRYGAADDPFDAQLGSSGGSGNGPNADLTAAGGAGGGAITLRADTITLAPSGAIVAAGAAGWDYFDFGDLSTGGSGGGGGAGGTIVLDATTVVTVEGAVSAAGGPGGAGEDEYCNAPGAGGGGGGRVKIVGPFAGSVGLRSVVGGRAGISPWSDADGERGGRGSLFVEDWVAGPPSATLSAAGGTTTLSVSGATPLGEIVLLYGAAAGADSIATGWCVGTVTGLAAPTIRASGHADALGQRTVDTVYDPALTGIPVQVLDVNSCTLSPVLAMP